MRDKKLRNYLFSESNAKCCNISRGQGYIGDIFQRLHQLEIERKDLVKCDKCKCLLEKQDAIKGKSCVKTKRIENMEWGAASMTNEEYIAIPYYCHRCNPKKFKK